MYNGSSTVPGTQELISPKYEHMNGEGPSREANEG